ncbi:MAG: hypothetical protein COW66_00630 [Flavobacteriaceae bacterium CG18_big_fil_WC_8_21_14_2_50_34_36]|nr:PAS domain S-box protein [Bacteroidota bacterium]PIQ19538.1 MAG: hypothetical protein COW66_00630 [Flavobacteriaceae bacterium CG18_big_fil_WC_8_21_14_2_50_34_36]PJC08490.1 MAG: hypothetical protein CO068_00765 [Flavobacteriaceae bacterium CG_4_9_14_0_8_um_filter_34_30]
MDYNILHIEDSKTDADIIQRMLYRSGLKFQYHLASDKKDVEKELVTFQPDIILCDHSMPSFNSKMAYEICKEKNPDLPFILVTGTVSEEFAVEMLKLGADDYILKSNLQRLPSAITNALSKKEARKNIEAIRSELQQSESHLRTIFENSSNGLLLIAKDYTIIEFNKLMAEFAIITLGRPYHKNENILNVLPQDKRLRILKNIRNIVKGERVSYEYTHSLEGENPVIFQVNINPTKDYEGKMTGACISVENITERKKAEVAINESEETFRRLFDESADANLLLDDTGFTRCNTSAVKILGYATKEEIIGRQPWEISPEKQPDGRLSKEKVKEMIKKALEYGNYRFEWIHKKIDETEFPVEVMLTPIVLKGKQFFYTNWRDISKRKIAEKELQDYKLALDESSLVDISDSNGIIRHANVNFCRLSKYSREELIGKSHRILNSGYHPKELFQDLWTTVKASKIWRNEVRNRAKDGSLFWVDTTIVPILDNDGKPFQFISIRRDITRRKHAEESLKKSEEEFRTLAESMPQIVWVTTADGKNIYFNHQWVEYTGLSLEESYGDGWLISFHEEDKPLAWKAWNNAVTTLAEYTVECRLQKYDGSYHWWLIRGVPKMNEKGEILKWYGTCTDIEKIKQAENQIRNSEVFNRSVVNSLSAHLAVVNDKGDIVSINEAWKRFALENCETSMKRTGVGSNYFEVCEKAFINGDEIAGRVLQGMKNVLNKKIEDFYLEYPCHSPSEQRWFGLRIAKFEGDEPLILLAHTNLTDRILAERERQKITDDLIHRNRDLEQFTYIVSHNLRAPVANIKGLSDILGDETLSIAEAGSVVKDLLSSVSKLDSVILDLNDILQLKIDVDRAKERVVFEELVKGVKESIHSLVVSEKVTIETRFDEVPEMFTLKSYLYSIFYNLISNSIKYKRSDAQLLIEIKSFRKKETIELVFKDNGKGIDLNKSRDQVFGLYKRFHRDIEGKGMGLFMVKTQVEALGGTISIESEVNKGTTFKILFTN